MVEMKDVRIPFVPLPLFHCKNIAKPFYSLGKFLSKAFPLLSVDLDRAEIKITSTEYLSVAIFSSIFWAILVFSSLSLLPQFVTLPENYLTILLFVSIIFGITSFIYIVLYPGLLVTKKIKDLERNLLFALRHLQIQIKSGVTLFDGLVSVANANYGLVSEQFKIAIKKISTGTPEIESLEDLAVKNPSFYFRRVIWQITNSMRSGSDLGETLNNMVSSLSNEQKIAIRKYGSQLNPLAMMYMMTAIIIPNLGITFLLILSSFSNFSISSEIFWIILVGVAFFQFSFIGLIKNRRPAIEYD